MTKAQTRTDRLKAALRENLKRRKTQARGRERDPGGQPQEKDDPKQDCNS